MPAPLGPFAFFLSALLCSKKISNPPNPYILAPPHEYSSHIIIQLLKHPIAPSVYLQQPTYNQHIINNLIFIYTLLPSPQQQHHSPPISPHAQTVRYRYLLGRVPRRCSGCSTIHPPKTRSNKA